MFLFSHPHDWGQREFPQHIPSYTWRLHHMTENSLQQTTPREHKKTQKFRPLTRQYP